MRWPLLAGVGWGFAIELFFICLYLHGELDDAFARTSKSIAQTDVAIALAQSCNKEWGDFMAYVKRTK